MDLFSLIRQRDERKCLELLHRGANPNIRDLDGLTPLHHAAKSDLEGVCQALVAHGASMLEADGTGLTPLHQAALHGASRAARCLLAAGCPVNALDELGATPLHYAALHDTSAPVARVLLSKGADPNSNASASPSSSFSSFLGGSAPLLRIDGTPLHWAALSDAPDVADLLLKHGALVNMTNSRRYTPLHVACEAGSRRVAEILILHRAFLNPLTDDGRTPLALTTCQRTKAILQRAIEADRVRSHHSEPLQQQHQPRQQQHQQQQQQQQRSQAQPASYTGNYRGASTRSTHGDERVRDERDIAYRSPLIRSEVPISRQPLQRRAPSTSSLGGGGAAAAAVAPSPTRGTPSPTYRPAPASSSISASMTSRSTYSPLYSRTPPPRASASPPPISARRPPDHRPMSVLSPSPSPIESPPPLSPPPRSHYVGHPQASQRQQPGVRHLPASDLTQGRPPRSAAHFSEYGNDTELLSEPHAASSLQMRPPPPSVGLLRSSERSRQHAYSDEEEEEEEEEEEAVGGHPSQDRRLESRKRVGEIAKAKPANSGRVDSAACVICMEETRQFACVPCGHLCLCARDREYLRRDAAKDNMYINCPVCRARVTAFIRIYDP